MADEHFIWWRLLVAVITCSALIHSFPSAVPPPSGQPPVDHCAAGAPLPPPLGCPSCSGRCGHLAAGEMRCSCDAECSVYGDCCADLATTCPSEFASSETQPRKNLVSRCVDGWETRLLSECRDGRPCNVSQEEINMAVPVVDLDTGRQYLNARCALCNDVRRAGPWRTNVSCLRDAGPLETVAGLEAALRAGSCRLTVAGPPEGVEGRSCLPHARSRCKPSCDNQRLVRLCESGPQAYTSDSYTLYRNYYCVLCSEYDPTFNYTCGEVVQGPNIRMEAPGMSETFSLTSLSMLFDFNPKHGLQVGKRGKEIKCPPDSVWVHDDATCRQRKCPPGYLQLGGECTPRHFNKTMEAAIVFDQRDDSVQFLEFVTDTPYNWREAIDRKVNSLFDFICRHCGMVSTRIDLMENNDSLNMTTTLEVRLEEEAEVNGTIWKTFIESVKDLLRVEFSSMLTMSGVEATGAELRFGNDTAASVLLVGTDPPCEWLIYNRSEFYLSAEGEQLILNGSRGGGGGARYPPGQYEVIGDVAYVCVELTASKSAAVVDYPFSGLLEVITAIFTVLSILCLLARIALQFLFAYFRSFAGRLQFYLCISLCLAYLLMLVGGPLLYATPREPCVIVGVLTYAAFLSAFGWMTAIALNTWVVFRPSSSFIKADSRGQSLLPYALLGWGLPALLAVLVASLDFAAAIEPRFRPGFGQPLCWLSQRYALLVYFGGPVAASIVANTVLFVLIVLVLRRTFAEAKETTTSTCEHHNVWIYVRLFTLMGISWCLGFVAAFTGHVAVWVLFTVLNASQGVLIFVSFVCRRPILRMIWKRYYLREGELSRSSQTRSSALTSDPASITLTKKPSTR